MQVGLPLNRQSHSYYFIILQLKPHHIPSLVYTHKKLNKRVNGCCSVQIVF